MFGPSVLFQALAYWVLVASSSQAYQAADPVAISTLAPYNTIAPPPASTPRTPITLNGKSPKLPKSGVIQPPTAGHGDVWHPKAGSKFQIVLGQMILKLDHDTPLVPDAEIFDIDMFHTPKEVISELSRRGKKVICYFSAGGTETWRPDNKEFKKVDVGDTMKEWKGEHWLNIRSEDVWRVMEKRIKYAYDKGCNAIDPDNLDAFNHESKRGGGFKPKLTKADTVAYLARLSNEAAKYGMSTGLKNVEELVNDVSQYVHFAVNEECASMDNSDGCGPYQKFLLSGKPVFHIEYVKNRGGNGTNVQITSTNRSLSRYGTAELEALYCQRSILKGKTPLVAKAADLLRGSTVIKELELGGFTLFCDGSTAITQVSAAGAENVDLIEDKPKGGSKRGGKGRSN
ncbi:hypothetical protein BT63DRAFT_441894 [Microthyrium microscopicum]|uniref:alpha-galactosidase n=1 Tax=Microthyrium microscopicum TaxID=703497 RepID=A0A6A6U5D3_9PEZI|nr:hypothetical protein BT63DRAFT_441894 [Microthyrium microscopicum]